MVSDIDAYSATMYMHIENATTMFLWLIPFIENNRVSRLPNILVLV